MNGYDNVLRTIGHTPLIRLTKITESLVCHPATMSHVALTPEERQGIGITDGTIRLSAGIEDVEDLIDDLDQALQNC